MEKILIIIGTVIILLFIVIYFEDYIVYFIKLLFEEIRHNRSIKKLMNENLKKRWLKNSVIKKYVNFIHNILKNKNYNIKNKYELNTYLAQKLKYLGV